MVRSGVGALDLIDDDRVCLTNLNRQIIATRKTVGRLKAEVMRERILEIKRGRKAAAGAVFSMLLCRKCRPLELFHRRLHACQKAGIETVPALNYVLDRDTPAIALVVSNGKMRHDEKSYSYGVMR